jgi:hypothetical protein
VPHEQADAYPLTGVRTVMVRTGAAVMCGAFAAVVASAAAIAPRSVRASFEISTLKGKLNAMHRDPGRARADAGGTHAARPGGAQADQPLLR